MDDELVLNLDFEVAKKKVGPMRKKEGPVCYMHAASITPVPPRSRCAACVQKASGGLSQAANCECSKSWRSPE